MRVGDNRTYLFGGFKLDASERRLTRDASNIPLAPKVFDTLLLLLQNSGRVVSKQRMLDEIWDGAFIEENNLAQNISILRRVLKPSFIETVPKLGYRFIEPVRTTAAVPAEENETYVERKGPA